MLMHSILNRKSVSTLPHHTLLVHQCLRFCPLILTDMSCSLISLARTLPTSTMQYCAYVLYLLSPLSLLNNLQTQVGHSNFIFRSVSLTSSQSAWQSRLLYTLNGHSWRQQISMMANWIITKESIGQFWTQGSHWEALVLKIKVLKLKLCILVLIFFFLNSIRSMTSHIWLIQSTEFVKGTHGEPG